MRYFRFFSDAERHDQTATWGDLTVLYEVDDDRTIRRQLNLYDRAPFVDKFDQSWPDKIQGIMRAKESYGRMRTEPLDEGTSGSNEISSEEFEFAWNTGALRERTFGEFKRELLNDSTADTTGVYEAWWYANRIFPHRPLSLVSDWEWPSAQSGNCSPRDWSNLCPMLRILRRALSQERIMMRSCVGGIRG